MSKSYKSVAPSFLKLLGFKQIKEATGSFPKGTWFNKELSLYYCPQIHTQTQFVENLVRDIRLHAIQGMQEAIVEAISQQVRHTIELTITKELVEKSL